MAYDCLDHTGQSAGVNVTVDNWPNLELTTPTQGQWLKKAHQPVGGGDEIILRATATCCTGMQSVTFWVSQTGELDDWHCKGQDTTPADGWTATWQTEESDTGLWYVKAVARSSAGLETDHTHTMYLFAIDLTTTGLKWTDGGGPPQIISVPDTEEDSPGAYIHYNVDNDNQNLDNSGVSIPDWTETGPVTGENDTRHMTMTVDPLPTSGTIVLSRDNSNAKVWSDDEKGPMRGVLVGSNTKTWHLSVPSERTNYQECADALWAEGVADGSCGLTLTLNDPNGSYVGHDAVLQTYVAALCGFQPHPTTRNAMKGIFPHLEHCEWSITDGDPKGLTPEAAERLWKYNCIAWSVGWTDKWVRDVVYFQGQYWEELDWEGRHWVSLDMKYGDKSNTFEVDKDLDPFYLSVKGWSPTASGPSDAQVVYYSGFHAARKKGCNCGKGKWIMYWSKVGQYECIEHVHGQLNGGDYGNPTRYYK